MLDNFRDDTDSSMIFDYEDSDSLEAPMKKRSFLGMTPVQRFVIALMLLVIAAVLSSFCLIVTEKVVLPFI
ncbi:MAG: hypothetical protein ACWGO1_05480 [Anaerolineales bacterium]